MINDEEESKVLLHYTDELMLCLMTHFIKSLEENCYYPVQEEILNVLFMVAVVIGDNFFNSYNVFMPGLKPLLMSLPGTTQTNHHQNIEHRMHWFPGELNQK